MKLGNIPRKRVKKRRGERIRNSLKERSEKRVIK
jgi:hypothetical protein